MTKRLRKKREGFVRRTVRNAGTVARCYVMEWSNDWLSMAIGHSLLGSTLTLAALSAWGFIP